MDILSLLSGLLLIEQEVARIIAAHQAAAGISDEQLAELRRSTLAGTLGRIDDALGEPGDTAPLPQNTDG